MTHYARKALFPAAALALWLSAGASFAADPQVKDNAGVFKADTVRQADEQIRQLKDRFQKDFYVETFKTVPADKAGQLPNAKAERDRFFATWAGERAKALGVDGIYLLICMNPGHFYVREDDSLDRKGFPEADRNSLRQQLNKRFGAKEFDQGLLEAVAFVRQSFERNLPAAGPVPVLNEVKDYGEFFTPDGVREANDEIRNIHQRYRVNVTVVTYKSAPNGRQVEAMSQNDRNQFYHNLGEDLARQMRADGILILMTRQPRYVEVGVGERTRAKTFTTEDKDRLSRLLQTRFRGGLFDPGLVDGLALIKAVVAKNPGPLGGITASPGAGAVIGGVKDNAHLFAAAAVQKADEQLKSLGRQYSRPVVIETFSTPPGGKRQAVEAMNAEARRQYFADWANKQLGALGPNVIYVLVCNDPGHVQVEVGPEAGKKFPRAEQEKLEKTLVAAFGQGRWDAGLAQGTELLAQALKPAGAATAPTARGAPATARQAYTPPRAQVEVEFPLDADGKLRTDNGIGGRAANAAAQGQTNKVEFKSVYLIYIALGLLLLWMFIGIIRSIFGSRRQPNYQGMPPQSGYPTGQSGYPTGQSGYPTGRPGPGYGSQPAPTYGNQPAQPRPPVAGGYPGGGYQGGGYAPGGYPQANYPPGGYPAGGYPPPQSGGGGGFLSGMLGGMFGAAAGNWIYDRVRGPGQSGGGWGASPAQAQSPHHPASPATPVSPDTGYSSTGGDFGESAGAAGGAFTGSGVGGDFGQEAVGTGGDFGQQEMPPPADAGDGGDFGQQMPPPADADAGGDFGQQLSPPSDGGDFGQQMPPPSDTGGDFGQDMPAPAESGGGDFGGGGDSGGGGDFGGGGDSGGGDSGGGGDGGGGDF